MPGRAERVTFTRKSAQRVAKMVRDAERGQRDMPAVKFRQGSSTGGGTEARLGQISSGWDKDSTLQVTKLNTDGTVSQPIVLFTAINWFADIPEPTSGTARVMCLLVGGSWFLIAAEC